MMGMSVLLYGSQMRVVKRREVEVEVKVGMDMVEDKRKSKRF